MHGVTLLELHQPRRALTRFLAARKFRPAGKPAKKLASALATAYGKIGSYHAALLYAREHARLAPNAAYAHADIAYYSAKVGDPAAAVAAAEKASVLGPNNKGVLVLLGDTYLELRRYGDARKYYERGIALDPDWPFGYLHLASFLATCPDAKERDGARAVKLAQETYDKYPWRRWRKCDPLMVLAESLAEQKEYDLAVRHAKEAIESAGPDYGRRDQLLERLAAFEKHRPWRTQPASDAARRTQK